MASPIGPGSPFELLFAEDTGQDGSLPGAFRQIYPGDWNLPTPEKRPYIYTNFAISRDGRISFNMPGQAAARYVTKSDRHDRWLMGLLRMRADAVLIGDGTIRIESDYLCHAEWIFPDDAAAFTAQRREDGRGALPLLVILSAEGKIPQEAACLNASDTHVILATTSQGAMQARKLKCAGQIDIIEFGDGLVDPKQLVSILYETYNVRTLLCEGGANVFGSMLAAGMVDEEFVTWCPTFVGRDANHFRPSYCEGVAWTPTSAPYSKPISLHKGGDYLYLRTRNMPQPVTQNPT